MPSAVPLDALVIEPHRPASEMLRRGLEAQGFAVTVVASWEEAWRALDAHVSRLLIVPLPADPMEVKAVCERLRGLKNGHRALVLARHTRGRAQNRRMLVACGVADFLADPMEPGELDLRLAIAKERILEREPAAEPASGSATIEPVLARAGDAALIVTLGAEYECRISYANPAFEWLTGYNAAAVVGRSHRVLVEGNDSEALLRCLRNCAREDRAETVQVRGLGKDGRTLPVAWSVSPIPSQDAATRQLLCLLRAADHPSAPDAATRAAEEKFRNLVDVSIQGVLVHQDWNLRFINRTLAEMLGYPDAAAVMAKRRLEELIAPEDRERLLGHNLALKIGRAPEHYELRMVRWDGSSIVLEGFAREVTWEGETAVLATYVDITDRKRAEAESLESRALLQAIFDAIPHNVYVKDSDRRYVTVNRSLAETWGRPIADILGRRFASLDEPPADERAAVDASDNLVLHEGLRSDSIISRTLPDGNRHQFRVIKVPLRDSAGRITGVVGLSEDVTDRLRAEDALRRSQALLQTVFDTIPHNVWVKDRQGRFIVINESTAQTWRVNAENVPGRIVLNEESPPDELARAAASDRRVLVDGETVDVVLDRTMLSGEVRRFRVIKHPLRDATGEITGLVGLAEDITERLAAEDGLRRSQDLLHTVFDTIPHGLFVKDREGRFLIVNQALSARWGVRPEDMIGMRMGLAGEVSPEERDAVLDSDRRVMTTGQIDEYIAHRRTVEGSVRHIRTIKAPVLDATGRVTSIVGVAEDITDRLRSEEELRQSRALFQITFDTIPLGVYVKDRAGRYVLVNRALGAWWGIPPQQFVGNEMAPAPERLESEREAVVATDQEVLKTGQTLERVYPVALSGGRRTLRMIKTPLRNGEGEIVGLVGIDQDITAQLEAQAALQRSQDLLQTVFDTIPHHLFLKDTQERYVMVNRAFAAVWGGSPADYIGQETARAPNTPPEEIERIRAEDRALLASGESIDEELARTTPESVHHYRVIKAPVRGPDGGVTGLVGIAEDITERKRADEALRASEDRYRRLIEESPHGILIHRNRAPLYVNPAFARLFGFGSPAEVLALDSIDSWVADEELTRVRTYADSRLRREGSPPEIYEFRGKKKDGTEIWVQNFVRPVEWEGQLSLQATMTDVTARKVAEQALIEREARWRSLIENMPVLLYALDPDGRILAWNREAERITGYRATDLAGKSEALERLRPSTPFAGAAEQRPAPDFRDREIVIESRNDGPKTLLWTSISGQFPVRGWWAWGIGVDITERKRAESALDASQRLLRTLIDTLPQSIHVKDAHGRYQIVNTAMASQHGVPVDALVGRTMADLPLREPDQLAVLTAADQRTMREDRLVEIQEMEVARPDGAKAWERTIKAPLHDDAGRVIGVVGISEDITARKRIEDELRHSQRLLQTVFDTLPQSLSLKDTQGRYLLVNQAFLRRNSVAPAAVHQETPSVLPVLTAEQATRIQEADQDVVRTGALVEIPEIQIIMGDGAPTWVRIIKAPYKDDTGRVTGIVSIAEDLTSRKRAEDDLRVSQRLLQTVINTLPQAIYVKDLRGQYQLVNSAVTRRFRLPAAAILNRTLEDLPLESPDVVERMRHADQSVLRSGELLEVPEMQVTPADRPPQWVRVVKTPLRNDNSDVVGIITIVDDITARKQAESVRLELERQVLHAQKLESLGVLAGGIAHDFNNLLTGILGNVELALMDVSANHPTMPTLQHIKQASLRAAALTQQMLAYSGRGHLQIRPVDLNALVDEMAQLLKVSISKKIAIQFELTPGLPPVEGDPAQLQQIVMNLITNASEAIGDAHGAINLATGLIAADRAYLADSYLAESLQEGRYVYMEVTDTGSGMTDEVKARIFDPFFTTKFTGRGLGLAAVLGIVRSHRGTIRIESAPGRGSTFRVLFPAGAGPADVPKRIAAPSEPEWRGHGLILVVDDESIVRSVMGRQLASLGFRVITVADGKEAIARFSKDAAGIRAVLLDMTMPEMGGVETLQELKRIRPDVRVIVCSGYSEQDAVQQFTGPAPEGFLQKPTQMADLTKKLREVLG